MTQERASFVICVRISMSSLFQDWEIRLRLGFEGNDLDCRVSLSARAACAYTSSLYSKLLEWRSTKEVSHQGDSFRDTRAVSPNKAKCRS